MDRCKQRNIKLNLDKIKLGLESVSYLGHIVLKNGLSADPSKIQAIREMPTLKDRQARNGQFCAEIFTKPFRNYVYTSEFVEERHTIPMG